MKFDFLYFCKCPAVLCTKGGYATSCGYCKVPLPPILISGNAFKSFVSGQQIRFLQFEGFRGLSPIYKAFIQHFAWALLTL